MCSWARTLATFIYSLNNNNKNAQNALIDRAHTSNILINTISTYLAHMCDIKKKLFAQKKEVNDDDGRGQF